MRKNLRGKHSNIQMKKYATNKEIYQSSQAQKLTQEEIENLKSTTQDKDELIKKIIENNTSMEKRTIFSQEKIIKK